VVAVESDAARAARAAKRRYYERDKEKVKKRARARFCERRRFLDTLKEGKPCARCADVFPPVAMDFHHRDPATKDKKFQWAAAGRERLLAEIEKCDLLCANCHRIEHWNEQPRAGCAEDQATAPGVGA